MVENQNPDMVLINVERSSPHECIRALLVLKDCGYRGVVQLFGNSDVGGLDSLNLVGSDCALTMLEPLLKPIKAATLHRIIRERKLGSGLPATDGITLAEALARDLVTFLYQPKFDLKAGNLVIGAEAMARVNHPRLGLLTPDCFLKGADQDDLAQPLEPCAGECRQIEPAFSGARSRHADFHQCRGGEPVGACRSRTSFRAIGPSATTGAVYCSKSPAGS